jgi:hypothetical protein
MTQPPLPLRHLRRHRRAALAAALLAVLALALAAAPEAGAGTYRAVQCHEPLDAGRADAAFKRSSPRYVASADCARDGLGIRHEPGPERTAAGRFGAWTLAAPAGTTIIRAAARISAAGADWHAPQAFVEMPGGAHRMLARVRGESHGIAWSGAAGRSLTARLVCSHRRSCGRGREAHIHLRRIALTLRDPADPTLAPAGTLLAPGSRRGLERLQVPAGDRGAGVRAVSVELNDEPLAARVFDCRLAGAVALRLRPCPASDTAWFELATTAPHFRQGPNRVRVCAADFAPRGTANRSLDASASAARRRHARHAKRPRRGRRRDPHERVGCPRGRRARLRRHPGPRPGPRGARGGDPGDQRARRL